MSETELFWKANFNELKQGYKEQGETYVCLLCGHKLQKGIIYPVDQVYYEAYRRMELHIKEKHGSVFEFLIGLDKKLTGLTDHQKNLLALFYQGKNDREIQKELEIGSSSTIRNHRFVLKEKERQAKLFLAMMELLKEKDEHAPAMLEIPKHATMIDDRYRVTEEENEKVLKKYFKDGKLTSFSMKQKYKIIVLREMIKRFDENATYTEKEVNEILKTVFEDFVTLRRYLIEYGFLDRKSDGSSYWIKK
ncbi:DUF2087 domain-containing protein [Bacillus testis]|uniref:DUF2087 domain-containing protein n=1 Tax=Bacillus testis TaxID=1622072 RepID=UPI00067ED5E2|nr:DUF2087 domain-containing protein [Bacillus testis]